MPNLFVDSGATFSPCRTWRYMLWRKWGDGPTLAAICLNPSTADETQDDPTVAGMVKRAKMWGYDQFVMLNLFALRSTDPRGLRSVADPIGPENDAYLIDCARSSEMVICAWGSASPLVPARAATVLKALRERRVAVYYLRMGKTQPWHPLYLPHALKPTVWATGSDQ